jgi:acyl dehydratase
MTANDTAAGTTPVPVPGPRPGATARRSRAVTARDIELFTELSGDRNPIHWDDDLASASRFGGIVVQGGVTSGLLNALVAEQLPGPGSVFLEVRWRFLAPVRTGDLLTAEATVTAVREDKPVTSLATRITNQDGVTVLDGDAVVWRDPVVAERSRPSTSNPSTHLQAAGTAGGETRKDHP